MVFYILLPQEHVRTWFMFHVLLPPLIQLVQACPHDAMHLPSLVTNTYIYTYIHMWGCSVYWGETIMRRHSSRALLYGYHCRGCLSLHCMATISWFISTGYQLVGPFCWPNGNNYPVRWDIQRDVLNMTLLWNRLSRRRRRGLEWWESLCVCACVCVWGRRCVCGCMSVCVLKAMLTYSWEG